MTAYCGIDWAEAHHDLALVDENGTVLAQRRIGDDLAGFNELLRLLAEHGDCADEQIPIAIETSRGLFVACLVATGRDVVEINPMAAARYRERTAVTRTKSDSADALMLANVLRTDRHAHRPLPNDTELVRAVAVLARAGKTPSGSGSKPRTSCDPYYGSTSRPHWSRSRSSTSAWPAPRPGPCWRPLPHPRRQPSCPSRGCDRC